MLEEILPLEIPEELTNKIVIPGVDGASDKYCEVRLFNFQFDIGCLQASVQMEMYTLEMEEPAPIQQAEQPKPRRQLCNFFFKRFARNLPEAAEVQTVETEPKLVKKVEWSVGSKEQSWSPGGFKTNIVVFHHGHLGMAHRVTLVMAATKLNLQLTADLLNQLFAPIEEKAQELHRQVMVAAGVFGQMG